ncbi:MAG: enoyl-CoA hydratase/isomerase family protein [Nocardioides sp.]|uniref:enoyl-CoA hydratase/isomerase family protein n=1 Tax=Nocardioides sp. TaxID=35761 RepID=UPI0039E31659
MSTSPESDVAALALETVLVERQGPVAVLTLNRPRVRNAIDDQMRADLRRAVDHLADQVASTAVRGVVLAGAGPAFCAGGDIRGMQDRLDQGALAAELGWRRQRELHATLEKLHDLGAPTLAAVHGTAAGLGLDVAMTCDFVWLADSAVVAASFVKRGLVPDGGGMYHLPRRVGLARAKELIFSGRSVDASEAHRIGLADRVLAERDLRAAAIAFLGGLAEQPPLAHALAKGVLNRSLGLDLAEVNELGGQAQAICYGSPAHTESVRRFLAERDARRASRATQTQGTPS